VLLTKILFRLGGTLYIMNCASYKAILQSSKEFVLFKKSKNRIELSAKQNVI